MAAPEPASRAAPELAPLPSPEADKAEHDQSWLSRLGSSKVVSTGASVIEHAKSAGDALFERIPLPHMPR